MRSDYTKEDVDELVDAMWQLLDDMGEHGDSVCGAAKAQARIAYEPFRDDDDPVDYPLEKARAVIDGLN